jgi:tetratricopeptide (TPR) repeat protein
MKLYHKSSKLSIIYLLFLFLYSNNSYSQSLSAEQIYKKVSGAVVVILAYNDNNELSTQGSGVVLNDKGYVVTNYHILSGNKRIEILHGKNIVPYVDIIGIDVEKDILILKIEAKKFPAVKLGQSNSLRVGQKVFAIGSPMGLENTITEGIISGLRNYDELRRNFIQISASISSGSSGGAILNSKGELIGISTLTIKEGQNLNFAIPIDDILKVFKTSYSKNDQFKNFELFKLGYDANENKNYQQALKYFSRYLSKNPQDARAYYQRGISKMQLKDYSGSIQDYNKSIELNSKDEYPYLFRAFIKLDLENYKDALQDCNKAIEINPAFEAAYYQRGILKSRLKDDAGAINDFNKVISFDPQRADAYKMRGYSKSYLKNYEDAIKDYNKCIEIEPDNAEFYSARADAKSSLKNDEGAIQDYNKAIELNPKYAYAYVVRGFTKYFLGDKEGACLDWSKAKELGSDSVDKALEQYCK